MRHRELGWSVAAILVIILTTRVGLWAAGDLVPVEQRSESVPLAHVSPRTQPTSMFSPRRRGSNTQPSPPPQVGHAVVDPRTRAAVPRESRFITSAERDDVMRKLSPLTLDWRIKPLGNGTMQIVFLKRGSFMDHCGMRVGDVITALNGRPPTSPAYLFGEDSNRTSISVLRDNQPLELDVEFCDRLPQSHP